MKQRVAVVASHPIQYHANLFRALAARTDIDMLVMYGHNATPKDQAAAGFGVEFDWDLDLIDGYNSIFLRNASRRPSVVGFNGIVTPEIGPLLRSEKFDAVILMGWLRRSDWQAMAACWRTRTPVMVRGDSTLETPRAPWKRALKQPAYRMFFRHVDACLAVGIRSAGYFRHYGVPANKIFLVHHSADESFSSRRVSDALALRTDIRESYQIPRGKACFLFCGKFIPKKRPMDFIRAVALAGSRGAPVAGLMVGDGPLLSRCQSEAERLGSPIRFAGFRNQTELPSAYVAADALVLPSDAGETWGMVVNEAMLCGRPAFVTEAVGCAPDLILDGTTGQTFPLGDVEAIARLMERYAREPDELSRMGVAATARVSQFSTDKAVEAVVRAIEMVLGPRPRARPRSVVA